MIWRLRRRRGLGLYLSTALCLGAFGFVSWQEDYGIYYFSLPYYFDTNSNSPTGVYSQVTIAPIASETLQLLQNSPSLFWDCNLPETPCRYFYPYRFFQQDAVEFQENYKELGGDNNNLPAMTALSWSCSYPTISNTIPLPSNFSFIHVHKSGGTTVKALLAQTKQRLLKNISNATAEIKNYKYSFGGGSLTQKEQNQNRRQAHLEAMVQGQGQGYPDAVVFSVLRDPLERFVSAVQQVMHYNDEFRQQCLKRTTRATLQCAIQSTRETHYLRDVHLIPMATHFRLWNQYQSARIAILHLQDIHVLAKYLLVVVGATMEKDPTNATTTTTVTMPHARDRSNVNYATSKVLANMNVARDCTPAMIQDLCQLYAIDVVLLKSLGYNSTYCT